MPGFGLAGSRPALSISVSCGVHGSPGPIEPGGIELSSTPPSFAKAAAVKLAAAMSVRAKTRKKRRIESPPSFAFLHRAGAGGSRLVAGRGPRARLEDA